MKRTIIAAALLAFSAIAMANPGNGQGQQSQSQSASGYGNAAGGVAVLGVQNGATSSVVGGYAAAQFGAGATSGTFTSGNESYADQSASFGTSNGYNSTTNTSNAASGFAVQNQTGSQDYGSSNFGSTANNSFQGGVGVGFGGASSLTSGYEGLIGAGGAGSLTSN